LLKGNVLAQVAQETADLNNGVKSRNEARVARGMSPMPFAYADYHTIPTNNLTAMEILDKVKPLSVGALDPDDVTAQDPTLKVPLALPAPTVDPIQPVAINAIRGVVADSFGRLLNRETQALRKASKKDDLLGWSDSYYEAFGNLAVETLAPALVALGAVRGREFDPVAVAGRLVSQSREEVRGLVTTTPPDELGGAVDRLISRWGETRVSEFTDYLLAEDA
jgi:hypothetical protein